MERFYRISQLMLATLIQRYDKKNHFIFDPFQKRKSDFYRLSDAIFYDRIIPCINLLNLSWIKMSIFEEYGAFNITLLLL